MNKKPHYRILVINGGGVKGIIPATILHSMSSISGLPIPDDPNTSQTDGLFDYIIGTSIGGILAAAYTATDSFGNLKFNSSYVQNLLKEETSNIFPDTIWKYQKGFFAPIYSRDFLDDLLYQNFGDLTLSETFVPISMMSYSLDQDFPRIWSSFRASNDSIYDYNVRDAAGATSAAPSYFPLKKTISPDGVEMVDIDGGIFANSPTMWGITDLMYHTDISLSDITVVAIGTGNVNDSKADMINISNSYWDWSMGTLIRKMMSASENLDIVESQNVLKRYALINPNITKEMEAMDNSSDQNINNLISVAEQYIESEDAYMRNIVKCLLQAPKGYFATCNNLKDTNNQQNIFEKSFEVTPVEITQVEIQETITMEF